MRKYGAVSPRFWIGSTGKKLRGDPSAQLLALYLVSCPHSTMSGIFHIPILYMAHETGIAYAEVADALERLIRLEFCEYDYETETVLVIRMAAFQVAETLKSGDKRIKGLINEISQVPDRLRDRFLKQYRDAFQLYEVDLTESPHEAPSKHHDGDNEAPLKPRQNKTGTSQEQEQDTDSCESDGSLSDGFAVLWNIWPTDLGEKGNRKRAKAQWDKLRPCELLITEINAGLSIQVEHKRTLREGKEFTPNLQHVERWLRDRAWENELPSCEVPLYAEIID